MAGTRFFKESYFLSTLWCGRLPAYSLCVFLRIKKNADFILYVKSRQKKMVEIPFCVFLRMKMHTKIHFIRKNAAKKLAEIRPGPSKELFCRKIYVQDACFRGHIVSFICKFTYKMVIICIPRAIL